MALEAVAHLEAQARAMDPQWPRRLERARSEADQAGGRSQAVVPDHRLVARSLARDWHETLTVLEPRERDDATRAPAAARHVNEAARPGILDVVHHLPAV